MRVLWACLRLWKTGFVPCRTFVFWWRATIGVMVGFWCLLALLGLNWTSSTKALVCGQCGKNTAWDFIVQSDHNTQITCGNIKLQRLSALIQVNFFSLSPCFYPCCVFLLWLYLWPVFWSCGSVDAFVFFPVPKPVDQKYSWDGERCEGDQIFAHQSSANASPWDRVVLLLLLQKSSLFIFPVLRWEALCSEVDILTDLQKKPKTLRQKQASGLLHVCRERDVFLRICFHC